MTQWTFKLIGDSTLPRKSGEKKNEETQRKKYGSSRETTRSSSRSNMGKIELFKHGPFKLKKEVVRGGAEPEEG